MNTLDLRVQEIFCQVIELPVEERLARLDQLCPEDPSLKAQVLSLLGHHDSLEHSHRFLDGEHLRELLDVPLGAKLEEGARVGQYSIIRFVGGGGMGDVYAARQERPSRTVALKIIRPGLATPRLIRLFERETEVLGRLAHPGIAQVYEAGIADYGYGPQPFLAMEFVNGVPLTEFLKSHDLPLNDKLALFAEICDAVQHAHLRGVIHRDLKPGNILVELISSSDSAQPRAIAKVLDFGVARTVASAGSGTQATTLFTSPGIMMGTLPYMSPEQLAGDQRDVDTRSDVYSLGVVLYRILSGRLLHDLTNLPSHEAIRRICEESPPRLGTINKQFKGDLETIVARAVERDRTRRYESASDLAADVRRFLGGQPILARQDSAFYVLTRQMRRYQRNVAVAAVLTLILAAAVVFSLVKANQESAARLAAQGALAEAEAQRVATDHALTELADRLRDSDVRRARLLSAAGRLSFAESILSSRPDPDAPDSLIELWARREITSRSRAAATIACDPGALALEVISPSLCIVGETDGHLNLYDMTLKKSVQRWKAHDDRVRRVRLVAPDRLLTLGDDGHAKFWAISSRELLSDMTFKAQEPLREAVIDDHRVAIGFRTLGVGVYDLRNGQELLRPISSARMASGVAANISKDLLIAGFETGFVQVWRLSTGEKVADFRAHQEELRGIVLTPDGETLITASRDRSVAYFSTSTWERTGSEYMANGWLSSLRIDPQSSMLVVGGWWRADLIDLRTRTRLPFSFPEPNVDLAVAPDGSSIVTLSGRGHLRIWKKNPIGESTIAQHGGRAMSTDLCPDGVTLLSTGEDSTLRVIDLNGAAPERVFTLPRLGRFVQALGTSRRAAVALSTGEILLVDIDTGESTSLFKSPGRVYAMVASQDGSTLYTGCWDAVIRKFDINTGTLVGSTPGNAGEILGLALSPDGRTLAATGRVIRLQFLDAQSLEQRVVADVPASFWSGRFTPDSKQFVGGTWTPAVEIVDVASGKVVRDLLGHLQLVVLAVPSSDGKVIYSVGLDGAIKVWSRDGEELASFELGIEAYWLTLTPDGFVVPTMDGSVRRYRIDEIDACRSTAPVLHFPPVG